MFIGIANSIGQRWGNGFDPDAQAFLSAAGITGTTETAAVNTLVTSLKGYGIWSKMKALYPFVTDNRNLLGYTEDFADSSYGKGSGISISTNSTISPFGSLTADKIYANITGNDHYLNKFPFTNVLPSTSYTFSVFAKKAEFIYMRIGSQLQNNTYGEADINLNDGSIVSSTLAIPPVVEDYGNGWFRISISGTTAPGQTSGDTYIVVLDNSQQRFYTGDGVSGIYTWGWQLESGSSATTYQPIATTQQSYISSQFKYNLKDPRDLDAAFRLVFNGGWTHSSTGATPNGTNGYADTKLALASHLTKGSGHLSYYSRTNSATSSSTTMGDNTGGRGRIILRRTGDVCYMECGTNGADSRTYTVTDSRCYALINVISNQDVDFFKNGTKQTASAVNSSNSGWSTNYVSLGAYSLGSQFDNKECAFSSIGDGLTDTEASNLYTAVQAFQTSLSRQV